ncbi:hypothetical protein SMF913_13355 [Streptomyces malaysiensis]|uniref:Uncharacterized protein n=1 Tax=Streptomyces malaysiensis TaxID=92644 RepID=A0A2J7ZAN3_STRMQ|nr:hypothetical protein SMF913_13355 [Streptomyces malaysiensis]
MSMGITFEIALEVSVKEGARDTVDQATSRVHGVPNPEEVAIHGTMDGTDPIPITPSPA